MDKPRAAFADEDIGEALAVARAHGLAALTQHLLARLDREFRGGRRIDRQQSSRQAEPIALAGLGLMLPQAGDDVSPGSRLQFRPSICRGLHTDAPWQRDGGFDRQPERGAAPGERVAQELDGLVFFRGREARVACSLDERAQPPAFLRLERCLGVTHGGLF